MTFQKDPNRKTKYLEAEPKALGVCFTVLLYNTKTALYHYRILPGQLFIHNLCVCAFDQCTQILLAVFLINLCLINYGLINEELRIAEIVNGIFVSY